MLFEGHILLISFTKKTAYNWNHISISCKQKISWVHLLLYRFTNIITQVGHPHFEYILFILHFIYFQNILRVTVLVIEVDLLVVKKMVRAWKIRESELDENKWESKDAVQEELDLEIVRKTTGVIYWKVRIINIYN